VKEHVEPLLKADFWLFETYAPRLAVLPYAVVACAAVGDDRVLDSQLEAWRERCGCESDFERRRFDATGPPWSTPHRWPVDDPSVFLEWFGPWVFNVIHIKDYYLSRGHISRSARGPRPPGAAARAGGTSRRRGP
jgi:hypothetical protein